MPTKTRERIGVFKKLFINSKEIIGGILLTGSEKVDLNGLAGALVLDEDGNTHIGAPTNDQIDITVGGTAVWMIEGDALSAPEGGTFIGNLEGNLEGEHTPLTEAIAADGPITIASGFVALTKSGVAAVTLTSPAAADNGKVLTIMAISDEAHVITYADGFNGEADDLATFGGATGDYIRLRAWGEVWYVEAAVNVTLSEDS